MSEELIRDFYGRVIGRIRFQDNGIKEIFDFQGRKLGWYDPTTNITRDFYGRVVARGDALTMLLSEAK